MSKNRLHRQVFIERAYQLSLPEIFGLVTIAALTLAISSLLHLRHQGGFTWLSALRLALMLTVFAISSRVLFSNRRMAEYLAGNTLFAIRCSTRLKSLMFLYSSEIIVITYLIRQGADSRNSMTLNAALLGGFVAFVVHRHLARFDRVEFCENGLLVGDTYYKMTSVVAMKLACQNEKLRLQIVISQSRFPKQASDSLIAVNLTVPIGVSDELKRYVDSMFQFKVHPTP